MSIYTYIYIYIYICIILIYIYTNTNYVSANVASLDSPEGTHQFVSVPDRDSGERAPRAVSEQRESRSLSIVS